MLNFYVILIILIILVFFLIFILEKNPNFFESAHLIEYCNTLNQQILSLNNRITSLETDKRNKQTEFQNGK